MPRIIAASTAEPRAIEQENEYAEQRRTNGECERPRCSRLTLDSPPQIEEIPRRQLQPLGQDLADLGGGAAQITPADGGLDGDSARPGLSPDGRRSECLRDVGQLAEGNLPAVMAVDQQRADGVEGVAPIVAEANDEIEPALTDPDLRLLFSHQADSHGSNHVTRRQADACRGFAVDGDLQLRQPGELLCPQVRDALDTPNQSLRLLRETRQFVQVRTEDSHRQIRRRPSQSLVDPHAQWRRKQHGDPGHVFELLTHVRLDLLESTRAVGLEDDEDIRNGVRHRILGPLCTSGPAHHVFDLRAPDGERPPPDG